MRPARLRFVLHHAVGAALSVILPLAAKGESTKERQALIFARVLSYELTLDERVGAAVGIAVVYRYDDALSEANAEDWYQGLTKLSSFTIMDRPVVAFKVPYEPGALQLTLDKEIDVLLVAD